MIAVLNRVVEYIEQHLDDEMDIAALATRLGTTEYHLRRMFSSLAGMPLSEYVQVLQETWAATATDRFPSNPWRLRPGRPFTAASRD